MQESEKKEKLATPIKWALGLSVMYILLFSLALFAQTASVDPEPYLGLRSMRPNELGDLFAGFFAPLAFIWLASTVFIQSHELAAQREELRETRRVGEKNVEYIGEQTRLATVQTELLVSEEKKQQQKEADERFTAIMNEFAEIVRKEFPVPFEVYVAGLHQEQPDLEHPFHFNFLPKGRLRLASSAKEIVSAIARNADDAEKVNVLGISAHKASEKTLIRIRRMLIDAKSERIKTSAAFRVGARRYKINAAIGVLDNLKEAIDVYNRA